MLRKKPDFELLLATLKNKGLENTMDSIGVKSWKLLLVDKSQNPDFSVNFISSGIDFTILLGSETITHINIPDIKQAVNSMLRELRNSYGYVYDVHTESSFKDRYRKLNQDQINTALEKADTLDNLIGKISLSKKKDSQTDLSPNINNLGNLQHSSRSNNTSPTLFGKNPPLEIHQKISASQYLERIQSDPVLWQNLMNFPEEWDNISTQIKNEIKKCSPRDMSIIV